ncbi:hypothetical protein NDU88_001810 [Pleurodeles waltl]|uniref:Uncharacterized protein n=1 Tax=Pleurodeles waltl TaxID=8319 RepID=A0AAV7MTT1_PLEWA|nr:hypothetical protein NDU88_001810 [Pleurodeles waltl]
MLPGTTTPSDATESAREHQKPQSLTLPCSVPLAGDCVWVSLYLPRPSEGIRGEAGPRVLLGAQMAIMGRHNAKQSKLVFDGRQQARPNRITEPSKKPSTQDMDFKEMLIEMNNSLHTIDAKIDLLTSWIDRIKESVDKHCDHMENHTSDVEDSNSTAS